VCCTEWVDLDPLLLKHSFEASIAKHKEGPQTSSEED